MHYYGERLRMYRKLHNLTQEQAAQKLSMPQSNYSRLEKGEQDIKASMISHICETFNISCDWFLGFTEEDENENASIFYQDTIDLICNYEDDEAISSDVADQLTHQISKLAMKYDII